MKNSEFKNILEQLVEKSKTESAGKPLGPNEQYSEDDIKNMSSWYVINLYTQQVIRLLKDKKD